MSWFSYGYEIRGRRQEGHLKVAFVGNENEIARVFGHGRRKAIEQRADVLEGVVNPDDPRMHAVEAIFSTWGMPLLTEKQLESMPKLRAVFYAAGAVGYFSAPLLARNIHISSAWRANAVPVAEFTLAQVILSLKGYSSNLRDPSRQQTPPAPGIFGETVALLGAGATGAKLIELLRPFRIEVIVFDPFMTADRAESLGVSKVSIEQAFSDALVVSNHLLDVPETVGLVHYELLSSLRRGATVINTGRGRTFRTTDLVQILQERPDVTALLDVTDPEPLPSDHPLRELPNAVVSTHIAGSIGDEVLRMADSAIEEFDRFLGGETMHHLVFG